MATSAPPLVVTLTFLSLNGYSLSLDEDRLFDLMIDISAGLSIADVADRLRGALHEMEDSDHQV